MLNAETLESLPKSHEPSFLPIPTPFSGKVRCFLFSSENVRRYTELPALFLPHQIVSSHLAVILLQEVPTDSGYFSWQNVRRYTELPALFLPHQIVSSHLAVILLQEVPTDSGYFSWHVANDHAVFQDS